MVRQLERLPDSTLVAHSRRGDRDAFGVLVRRYQDLILRVAFHTGADPELAQDVAQEAFIRGWQALPTFQMRTETSFRAWICRIASNYAVDQLRRRRPQLVAEADTFSIGENPEAILGQQERAEAVRLAIGQLPESSRQALVLRVYGELSYREISQALDIPVGTVMSRLHYARATLRQVLGPYLEEKSNHA